MVRSGDCSAGTLGLTDRPVLVEGGCALDGRLIGANTLINVIHRAITGHGALVCERGCRVVGAVVFDDVVLYKWASSPAVDGEVAVTAGLVVRVVCDGPNVMSASLFDDGLTKVIVIVQ